MNMRTTRILVACALLFTASVHARDANPIRLKEGMNATEARKLLLKDKWIANPSKHSREVEMWGLQKRLYQRGFKEIDECAVDRSVCLLKYKKDQACLVVEIEGERANAMRVIGWSLDCEVDS